MKTLFFFFGISVCIVSTISFYSCSKDESLQGNSNSPVAWRSGSLTQLTDLQYQNLTITEFDVDPELTVEGSPGINASMRFEGWGPDSALVLSITSAPYINASLTANDSDFDDLTVNKITGTSSTPVTKHWLLEFGNSSHYYAEWTINVAVQAYGTNTGTWKFTKGKS